jgi:hypothetical protein
VVRASTQPCKATAWLHTSGAHAECKLIDATACAQAVTSASAAAGPRSVGGAAAALAAVWLRHLDHLLRNHGPRGGAAQEGRWQSARLLLLSTSRCSFVGAGASQSRHSSGSVAVPHLRRAQAAHRIKQSCMRLRAVSSVYARAAGNTAVTHRQCAGQGTCLLWSVERAAPTSRNQALLCNAWRMCWTHCKGYFASTSAVFIVLPQPFAAQLSHQRQRHHPKCCCTVTCLPSQCRLQQVLYKRLTPSLTQTCLHRHEPGGAPLPSTPLPSAASCSHTGRAAPAKRRAARGQTLARCSATARACSSHRWHAQDGFACTMRLRLLPVPKPRHLPSAAFHTFSDRAWLWLGVLQEYFLPILCAAVIDSLCRARVRKTSAEPADKGTSEHFAHVLLKRHRSNAQWRPNQQSPGQAGYSIPVGVQ